MINFIDILRFFFEKLLLIKFLLGYIVFIVLLIWIRSISYFISINLYISKDFINVIVKLV